MPVTADESGSYPIHTRLLQVDRDNVLHAALREDVRRIVSGLGYVVETAVLPTNSDAGKIRARVLGLLGETNIKLVLPDLTVSNALERHVPAKIKYPFGSLDTILGEAAYLTLCADELHNPQALECAEGSMTKTMQGLTKLLEWVAISLDEQKRYINECVVISDHLGDHHPFLQDLVARIVGMKKVTSLDPRSKRIRKLCNPYEKEIAERLAALTTANFDLRRIRVMTGCVPLHVTPHTLIMGDRHVLERAQFANDPVVLPMPLATAFSAAHAQGLTPVTHMPGLVGRVTEVFTAQAERLRRDQQKAAIAEALAG